jgi:hypothetical protein
MQFSSGTYACAVFPDIQHFSENKLRKENEMAPSLTQVRDLAVAVPPLNQETVFDLAAAVEKAGRHVSISHKVNPPVRMESLRRAHGFHDLPGFVAYLEKFGVPGKIVVLVGNDGNMTACLNEDEPRGRETVHFVPSAHPALASWLPGATWMAADKFIELLRLNRRSVFSPSVSELIAALSQIKVSRVVEVNEGIGKASVNGLLCATKIQGNEKSQLVDLPEHITIDVPVFFGRPVRRLEADLLYQVQDESGSKVQLRLVFGDLAAVQMAESEELVKELRGSALAKHATIGLGSYEQASWTYVGA